VVAVLAAAVLPEAGDMKKSRILKHLTYGRLHVRRCFPASSMQAIEAAIARSESSHMGELRFAVEAALDWRDLLRGVTPHERAIEVFSQLRIWDTEHNSGVLIYLLLAERRVEIVADRGIHTRVGNSGWAAICHEMEAAFRAGDFEHGVLAGILQISTLLAQHFPAKNNINHNELPDAPVVL
jgi:hypothetical protein